MPDGQGQSEIEGQPGINVSIRRAALSGLCPRCGAPTLFDAPASIAFNCAECGLAFGELERGSRLAGLITILFAVMLIALAMAVDVIWQPPLWLQAVVWAPVTILGVIGLLRMYKTALLYRQYELSLEKEADGE